MGLRWVGLFFIGLLYCPSVLLAEANLPAGQRHCLPLGDAQSICAYEYHPEAARTVVLIHGLNGAAREDWTSQIRLLARQYHVLAVELPGFDDPEQLPEHYSTEYFASAVSLLLQRYAKAPYTLIGHSMGGVIALHVATEQGEQLERLVLISVPGLLHRLSYSREVIGRWAGATSGQHSGFSAFVEKLGMKVLAGLEAISGKAQPSDRMLRMMADNPQAMAAMQLATRNFSETLHQVGVPVLLLWGEQDRIAPLRTAHVLLARLPDSRLQIFPDIGHVPMTQATEAFNRTLQEFVMLGRWPERAMAHPQMGTASEQTGRVADCRGQDGLVYEGDYDRITIQACEAILIRNARVGQLQIRGSRVEILHSRIGTGDGVALLSQRADIKITASELVGQPAISATGSRIDLAGVSVSGWPALHALSNTDVLISLSEWRQEGRSGYLHDFYPLGGGDNLPINVSHPEH